MTLPRIETPMFEGNLASTGETIKFRPFLVKEEKILMLASAGGEFKEMVNACAQIVTNCCDGKIEGHELAMFDLQDLFLKIRSKSVGETADFTLTCGKCKKTTPYELELDKIKVVGLENPPDKFIKINEDMGVQLQWPTALVAAEIEELTDDELVAKCIDYVVDGEETFSVANETPEEIGSFVEDLPIDVMDKMRAFFQQMPRIEHIVEYKCPHCETENKININGYEHFFG
jgi:hypothetical protein